MNEAEPQNCADAAPWQPPPHLLTVDAAAVAASSEAAAAPPQVGAGDADDADDVPAPLSADDALNLVSRFAHMQRENRNTTTEVCGWSFRYVQRPPGRGGTKGDMYVQPPGDGAVIRSLVGLKRRLGMAPPPSESTFGPAPSPSGGSRRSRADGGGGATPGGGARSPGGGNWLARHAPARGAAGDVLTLSVEGARASGRTSADEVSGLKKPRVPGALCEQALGGTVGCDLPAYHAGVGTQCRVQQLAPLRPRICVAVPPAAVVEENSAVAAAAPAPPPPAVEVAEPPPPPPAEPPPPPSKPKARSRPDPRRGPKRSLVRDEDGTYRRPAGRTPKNKAWDAASGRWVNADGDDDGEAVVVLEVDDGDDDGAGGDLSLIHI